MSAQSSPIRVLHIFGVMDRGGAEMRTLELYRQLDRSRYIFEFCALGGQPGELDEEIRSLGGAVHLIRLDGRFVVRFMRLLRERRYSAVHSHVHLFSGFILTLAALAGIPQRIAHFRSTADGKGDALLRRTRNSVLRFLLDRSSTDIVGVSEAALDIGFHTGWRSDPRCRLIYSGVEVENFRRPRDPSIRAEFGIAPDSTVVVHVGRMSPEKNHERLVRIFLQLVGRVPDARLLLVGKRDPAIEQRLTALAAADAPRMVFAGVRGDIGRLLAAADLMIFPSFREGLPGAVVEASAAGIPVLASDIPGIAELAGVLPGLQVLPLSQPDSDWSSCAIHALANHAGKEASYRSFPEKFNASSAHKQFQLLYDRPGRQDLTVLPAAQSKGTI